jgi:hypothetical protein
MSKSLKKVVDPDYLSGSMSGYGPDVLPFSPRRRRKTWSGAIWAWRDRSVFNNRPDLAHCVDYLMIFRECPLCGRRGNWKVELKTAAQDPSDNQEGPG